MSFPIHSVSAYRRRRKRMKLFMILFAAVLVITVCAAPALLKQSEESNTPAAVTDDIFDSYEDTASSAESSSEVPAVEPTAEPAIESSSEIPSADSAETSSKVVISQAGTMSSGALESSYATISGPSFESSSSDPDEGAASSSAEVTAPEGAEVPDEVFTGAVAECPPVDDSYFDKAVFVGNSRTQGLVLYSGLSNVTAYTDRGLNVKSAASKEVVSLNGKNVTVLEALRRNTSCEAVYLMFGINELGWPQKQVFIEKYAALIDAIQENNPEAKIYVQSILPVSKSKSDSDEYINNTRIQEFNTMILDMAISKQVYFLDLYAFMADENGFLPEEAAFDGIHLKKSYCEKWLEYLRTHVA